MKIAKNRFYRLKFTECGGDSKKIWANINDILGKKRSNVTQVFKINDENVMDKMIIANEFNNYFTNIAHEIDANLAAPNRNYQDYLPNLLFDNIHWTETNETEIKSILSKCNNTKAGPDKLPMQILKKNADFLAPVMKTLCNLSINTGVFPTIHKMGTVIPLYKNKERNKISNYRPICLLNAMSKVLEKVIAIRLMNHLEANNVLSNSQYAYRHGRGTDSAILKLVNNIVNNFEKGEITVAAFLDLSKAFDCVNHEILIKKLEHYGVNGVALNWFTSYLYERQQRVYYHESYSEVKTVNIGVPQGSVLGPILFLTYFQDIGAVTDEDDVILFADDVTTYDSGNDVFQVIQSLNRKLSAMSQWLLANRLSANVIKTEGMIFSRKNLYYPLPPLLLYGNPLPFCHSFKFLGVIVDSKLTWKDHVQSIQNKLSSASGILFSIRNKITRSLSRMIYFSIAYPYMIYCNIIWGSCYNRLLIKLFNTQKKLVRLIMKRGRMFHSEPLFEKLNLLNLYDILKMSSLVYIYKTLNHLIHSPINFNFRNVQQYNLRNNNVQLEIPYVRYRHSQLFIHVRGPSLWNDIPESIRSSRTLPTFKRNLKQSYINMYNNIA